MTYKVGDGLLSHIDGKATYQEMIAEVLLALPLYVILFVIWWQFCYIIKMMADAKSISNKDEFFVDNFGTLKEVVEHYRK